MISHDTLKITIRRYLLDRHSFDTAEEAVMCRRVLEKQCAGRGRYGEGLRGDLGT